MGEPGFREPPCRLPRSPQVGTSRGGRGCATGREAAAAPASIPPPLLPLRRAPRLSHCGSRGPINRESDVLRSREWRGPGNWGRGRAKPQAPAPPSPQSRELASGLPPPITCEGSLPLGVTWRGSCDPSSWGSRGRVLVGHVQWPPLTDLGALPCRSLRSRPLFPTQPLHLVPWNRRDLPPT